MRFDLSAFYLLLQAFDLTGRHLYGNDWRGDEAFARDNGDPSPLSKERQSIQDRIKNLALAAAPHQAILAVDADEAEHQAASDALHHITREANDLKEQLATLPEVTSSWFADYEAFQRRADVESKICAAFQSGDLSLQVGPYEIVQWRTWSRKPDFEIVFSMSCVRVPASHAGEQRSGPALIPRVAFNKWISRFSGAATGTEELTPEGQLELWLREKTKRPKEFSKAEYKAQAFKEVTDLSERSFDRIWANTVPDSWKQSGRLRG